MTRVPYIIPNKILKEVIEVVALRSGYTANSNRGCMRLSGDIYMSTNEVISARTLYRLF
jgi:hypothetical protein